jgi:hypothetical protein
VDEHEPKRGVVGVERHDAGDAVGIVVGVGHYSCQGASYAFACHPPQDTAR